VTERFPNDWPAWFQYADNLFHFGPVFGSSNANVRAALQRAVDLNPKLVPMWEHLAQASLGHDSVQAALAVRSLMALGKFAEYSRKWGMDGSLFFRLPLVADGQPSAALIDSLARGLATTREIFPNLLGRLFLTWYGFPAAQVELNHRLLARDPHGPFAAVTWSATAIAWAARGAWDSALAARDRYVQVSPEAASPAESYRLASAGAWLGGVDYSVAAQRRSAAVEYLSRLPGDSASDSRAAVAWSDGILAALRRDVPGLAAARADLRRSRAAGAGALDRMLGGFALDLNGSRRQAVDSLEALDLAATDGELAIQDAWVRSIAHLHASRLCLELGDTARALKLLTWHDADLGFPPNRANSQIFAPLAYYELARIEEAQGRAEAARDHYQQFLRRYDMPPAAHKHLVDEARASLRKLFGQHDVPVTQ
jgi:tetratricopeptide (TPR) repeat protein